MTEAIDHINQLYTDCRKDAEKKKTKKCKNVPAPTPSAQKTGLTKEQQDELTALLVKVKHLEEERMEADKRFDAFILESNSLSKKVEETAEKRVAALESDVEEWKAKYVAANEENVKLNLRIGELDRLLDDTKITLDIAESNTSALKAEVAAVRAELDKMRISLLNDSRTEKDLKDAAIAAIEEARLTKQKLVDAEKTSQYQKLDLVAYLAKTEELEAELKETNSQLDDANATNEVAFDSVKEWEDFLSKVQQQGTVGVASSMPKFSKEQIAHIASLMDTKAILQSKRQKAGSLMRDLFKKMLDVSKTYGDAVVGGKVDQARTAITKGTADLKKAAEKLAAFIKSDPRVKADAKIGELLTALGTSFTLFLTQFSALAKKSGEQITANKIDKLVTKESCATEQSVDNAFIASFPKATKEATDVAKGLSGMIALVNAFSGFVTANKVDQFIDTEEQVEQRLRATLSDTIFYAVSQITRVPANVTASSKKRQTILESSYEIGSDAYTALTGSEDRSLGERAKEKAKKLNPFKGELNNTEEKPTSFKSPFKQNLATNSSVKTTTLTKSLSAGAPASKTKKFVFRTIEL